MRSSLSRGAVETFAILCLRLLSQAATLILATRLLGPHEYGSYASVAALAVLLGVLPNIGTGYLMLADTSSRQEIWRFAWPTSIAVGLLLLVLFIPLARIVDTGNSLSMGTLLTMGTTELLIMPMIYLASFALQASERVSLGQFVQWFPLGLRTLAAIPCYFVDDTSLRLPIFVAGQTVLCTLALAAALIVTQRCVAPTWGPRVIGFRDIRKSAPYALMHFVAMNPSELDKVMVLRFAGPADAGIYSAASRVMSALVTPVLALLLTAQPRLFQHSTHATNDTKRLIAIIAALAVGWGACTTIILLLSRPLLPWLFGNAYQAMHDLMTLLALACPLLALRMSSGTILVALGSPSQRIFLELAGIASLTLGMALLAPRLGLAGVVWSVILSELVMLGWGWLSIMRRLTASRIK